MKHGFLIAAALAVAVVGLREADAGSKLYYNVQVNHTTKYATGALGTVRSSSDTTQYMGCYAYYWPGVSPSLTCYAQPVSGTGASCSTNDAAMVSMFAALPSDALLRFEWEGGTCTEFFVNNGSQYQPKVP
jgi:hypothetical protein